MSFTSRNYSYNDRPRTHNLDFSSKQTPLAKDLSSIWLCKYSGNDKPKAYIPDLAPHTTASNANDLRVILEKSGDMARGDRFVRPNGFVLRRGKEKKSHWEDLRNDDNGINLISSLREPDLDAHQEGGDLGRGRGMEVAMPMFEKDSLPEESPPKMFSLMSPSMGAPVSEMPLLQVKPPVIPGPEIPTPERPLPPTPILKETTTPPDKLSDDEWMNISDRLWCLHGIVLGSGPNPAPKQLIKRSCLSKCFTHQAINKTTLRVHTVSTERNHIYSISGWCATALEVTTPVATAGIEAKYRESLAKDARSVTSLRTGSWRVDRAQLYFDSEQLELTQEFEDALDKALEADSRTRKKHVARVFRSYGHVFCTSVLLGGSVVATYAGESQGVANKQDGEVRFSAGAGASGIKATGGVGLSVDLCDILKFKFTGGSVLINGGDQAQLQTGDPWKWIDTFNDYAKWEIIQVDEVVSVLDLIRDEKKKQKILDLFPERPIPALRGVWTKNVEWAFPDNKPPVYIPQINDGDPYYWIGQSLDPKRVLLVKELIPGALCGARYFQPKFISYHIFARKRKHLIEAVPQDPGNFTPLVPCIYGLKALPNVNDQPWKHYGAVNNDLLVSVTCGEELFLASAKAHGYHIHSIKQAETSVDLGLFFASADGGSKAELLGIRAGAIEFRRKMS